MPRRPHHPTATQPPDSDQQVRTLLAETQALSARLAALNEVAAAMQSSLDTMTVLRTLAREARWVIDFQYCALTEWADGQYIEHVLAQPAPGGPTQRRAALADSAVGQAVRAGHALLLSSTSQPDLLPAGMGSGLIMPLRSRGEMIGTLNFFAAQADLYRLDDLRIAAALAAQAGVLVQNTRLFTAATAARDELHTVLESISDGVIVLSAGGTVMLLNRAARTMLGLPDRPLAGRPLAWLALYARAHGQRAFGRGRLRALARQLQSQSGGLFSIGGEQHIEWSLARMPQGDAQEAYVLSLHDVSDRVQLDEMRDDLIAMLVHDLRTPLAAIMLSIDMLGYIGDSDPQALQDVTQRARQSAQQMMRKVNTLLDLRKLEAGQLSVTAEPMPIGGIVAGVVEAFAGMAAIHEIGLRSTIPLGLPLVRLDSDLITRVLENLVGNALKFTLAQGSVQIEASPDAGMMTVQISDSGMGVPAEMRERIFEKFIQLSGAQERRGSGLGLAFCRMVVEAHGGTIGVRENPGGGSIFWFTLPLA